VLARSVYSDVVFVDALLRMGWVTENCEHFVYIYILDLNIVDFSLKINSDSTVELSVTSSTIIILFSCIA